MFIEAKLNKNDDHNENKMLTKINQIKSNEVKNSPTKALIKKKHLGLSNTQ